MAEVKHPIEKSDNARYISKNKTLFALVSKIKLWPSQSGVLHGVKSVELHGDKIIVTTHCGETFTVWNSKNSRSTRWLRNRWFTAPCPRCKVPDWKLEKYGSTIFTDSTGRGGRR